MVTNLRISDELTLPVDAVTETFGVLGIKGEERSIDKSNVEKYHQSHTLTSTWSKITVSEDDETGRRWRAPGLGTPTLEVEMHPQSTLCSIPDCSNPPHSRGLCTKHYSRWLRTKHPEVRTSTGLPPRPMEQRFWANVHKDGPVIREELGPCWVYGPLDGPPKHRKIELPPNDPSGKRNVFAHRYSYALHKGPIPEGQDVCHRCDNPPCVRPSYLFLGTQLDNVADMWSKGRASAPPHRFGEAHPRATLSDLQVAEIRSLIAEGRLTQRDIAVQYGVSQSTVWRLGHRRVRAEVAPHG